MLMMLCDGEATEAEEAAGWSKIFLILFLLKYSKIFIWTNTLYIWINYLIHIYIHTYILEFYLIYGPRRPSIMPSLVGDARAFSRVQQTFDGELQFPASSTAADKAGPSACARRKAVELSLDVVQQLKLYHVHDAAAKLVWKSVEYPFCLCVLGSSSEGIFLCTCSSLCSRDRTRCTSIADR